MHMNLTAYEGVEQLQRFTSETFAQYCEAKLASCDKHIAFIKEHCINSDWRGRVCEVGSGSGKLLFRLEKEGLIEEATGYEISSSRCQFAEQFSKYCGSSKVKIFNQDFLSAQLPENTFDLVIGIDVVLNLIGAISSKHTTSFLSTAYRMLRPQCCMLLELMTCEREINFCKQSENKVYRTWKHFHESDPFIIGLDEIFLVPDSNLVWNKYFVSRSINGKLEKFSHIIKPFNKKLITEFTFQALNFHQIPPTISFFEKYYDQDIDTIDQEFLVKITK